MVQKEALSDSNANSVSSSPNHGPTNSRDAGRALARIGDNLNYETLARRSANYSTVVFLLQMGEAGGVSLSFLIPFRVQFHFETEMSFGVFIIRFTAGLSFIQAWDVNGTGGRLNPVVILYEKGCPYSHENLVLYWSASIGLQPKTAPFSCSY